MLDFSQILLDRCKVVRVMNAVAAGTSDQTSSAIDTQGFEGCLIVAGVGALSANQVTELKAQQSSDDAVADDYTDLEGTKLGPLVTANDANKLLALNIHRPEKRYLKGILLRETGNAVIDFMIAILYGAKEIPTTQPSTVAFSEAHVTPAEGTA